MISCGRYIHGGFSVLVQANITFVTSTGKVKSNLLDGNDTIKQL